MTTANKSPRKEDSKPSSVQSTSKPSKGSDVELFTTSLPGFPGQAKIVVLARSSDNLSSLELALIGLALKALFSKFKIK